MKQLFMKGKNYFYGIFALLITLPVWADMPTPPSEDIANSSQDWVDVGGSLAYRGLKIFCLVVGVIIFVGAAGGILKSYQAVHERQEYGHFIKALFIGLIVAAIGIALVYAGWSILPTS